MGWNVTSILPDPWVKRKVKDGIRYADIFSCLLSTLLIVKSGTVLEEYDKATDLVRREIVKASLQLSLSF